MALPHTSGSASSSIDQGDDRYGSSGPFYNGGVAWDNSVSLMLDAGKGRDIYTFERSTGLGRADYAGWGLFIDEGGEDQYRVNQASETLRRRV